MKQTEQGKGFVQVLLLVAVVIVIAGLLFYQMNKSNSSAPAPTANTNQPASVTQTPAPKGVVALSLNPSDVSTTLDSTFTVDIQIDTQTDTVSAAELHLSYDPAFLQATDIKDGTLLPVVLSKGSTTANSADIAIGANPTAPQKGTGTLATVTFKALKIGSTNITFGDTTATASIGKTKNTLGSTSNSTVTIK